MDRSRRSRCADPAVHDAPIPAFTMRRNPQNGQSLAKATRQIERVKAVKRPAVSHDEACGIGPNSGLKANVDPGLPTIRNPYYAAIWARDLKVKPKPKSEPGDPARAFLDQLNVLKDEREELPDAIVAGSALALPIYASGTTRVLEPFECATTELVTLRNDSAPWGIALAHLLWAIEWVRLGNLPWSQMITEQFGNHPDVGSSTPSGITSKPAIKDRGKPGH